MAVAEPAVTTPPVFASAVLSSEAARLVSLSVTISLPNPLIVLAAYAALTSDALPVSVVTSEALIAPDVLLSIFVSVVAASVVSVTVTASVPNPVT